jgi:hypothetical protein
MDEQVEEGIVGCRHGAPEARLFWPARFTTDKRARLGEEIAVQAHFVA